jgi:hypothetical protein
VGLIQSPRLAPAVPETSISPKVSPLVGLIILTLVSFIIQLLTIVGTSKITIGGKTI